MLLYFTVYNFVGVVGVAKFLSENFSQKVREVDVAGLRRIDFQVWYSISRTGYERIVLYHGEHLEDFRIL